MTNDHLINTQSSYFFQRSKLFHISEVLLTTQFATRTETSQTSHYPRSKSLLPIGSRGKMNLSDEAVVDDPCRQLRLTSPAQT